MEDAKIVDLYWQRSEDAITETKNKYHSYCSSIALNLLFIREDAEECVSDTYLAAWNSMPEERPDNLKNWLGRVVRNISVSRWRKEHSQKRFGGMTVILDELKESVPAPDSVEKTIEQKELAEAIARWLITLSADERAIFIRRYWDGESVNSLATEWNISKNAMAKRLQRLRESLKKALETADVNL